MSIVVLALDVAKNRTGWAVHSPDWKRPQFGVFETANWETSQDSELHRFHLFLQDLHKKYGFTHVATEKIFVNVKAFDYYATEAQMMLNSIAWEFAASYDLWCSPIPVGDWRLLFLGINRRPKPALIKIKGRSKKPSEKDDFWKRLAIKVCSQKHNWFVEFHDEAEALGIAHYALCELDKGYRARTTGVNNRTQQDADLRRGAHEA